MPPRPRNRNGNDAITLVEHELSPSDIQAMADQAQVFMPATTGPSFTPSEPLAIVRWVWSIEATGAPEYVKRIQCDAATIDDARAELLQGEYEFTAQDRLVIQYTEPIAEPPTGFLSADELQRERDLIALTKQLEEYQGVRDIETDVMIPYLAALTEDPLAATAKMMDAPANEVARVYADEVARSNEERVRAIKDHRDATFSVINSRMAASIKAQEDLWDATGLRPVPPTPKVYPNHKLVIFTNMDPADASREFENCRGASFTNVDLSHQLTADQVQGFRDAIKELEIVVSTKGIGENVEIRVKATIAHMKAMVAVAERSE